MNIVLKETGEADLDFVIQAENDPANSYYVDHWDYNKHRDSLMESDVKHMIIFNKSGNIPVGYSIMAGFSGRHKCAELKRLVITDKGKGYGQQALDLIKEMVFRDLDFHRLWLDVKEHNILAKTIYEKNGFKEEGHLRECVYVEDHYESIYIMGLLKSEYAD